MQRLAGLQSLVLGILSQRLYKVGGMEFEAGRKVRDTVSESPYSGTVSDSSKSDSPLCDTLGRQPVIEMFKAKIVKFVSDLVNRQPVKEEIHNLGSKSSGGYIFRWNWRDLLLL